MGKLYCKNKYFLVLDLKFFRIPFLEENFVSWLNRVPLSVKVNFSLPRGYGEKRLLRRALLQLGVSEALAFSHKQGLIIFFF